MATGLSAFLMVLLGGLTLQTSSPADKGVVPGLEVLLTEQKSLIEGKRVGLITNHCGVDRQVRHIIDLLPKVPNVKVTALFALEHGVRGMVQAGGKVVDTVDPKSGIRMYSLYGETRRPTPEMLQNVDALIYDIQDVGVRFYTYISSMGEGMEAAAEKGIPFIVLDRPNPIADVRVEGGMLDIERFKSFVGAYVLPIRYGLTLGELARYVKAGMKKDLKLTVVKMKNYRRSLWYDDTGLPWIAPSPNIPSLATAIVYPGMCLFEGTNISEGRGTTQPFEMIGAPWLDGDRLAQDLSALKLPGVLFRAAGFTPSFSKYQGEGCLGIQVHVTDRRRFEPVRVALHILAAVKKNHPDKFQWRENSIDRLSGSEALRKAIDAGTPVDKILAGWQPDLKKFDEMRKRYFLYP
jgi:uncharacterized protein YbbC (DUF1343 family)